MWDTMPMEQAFCRLSDDGANREQENKSICGVSINYIKD